MRLLALRLQVTSPVFAQKTPPRQCAGAASAKTTMRSLELKVPPLALVILTALLMRLAATALPGAIFDFPLRRMIASTVGAAGFFVCVLGALQFKRAGTTLNPIKPQSASSLVTSGIYRRTRNPMYLGFFLMLVALALAIANAAALAALPAFVLYMNRFQIEPEERALTHLFGNDFKAYCLEAPRWI